MNKIKKQEEIGIKVGGLEIKIIKERMKEELKDFEIEILEIETEIKTENLKLTEKTVRKK